MIKLCKQNRPAGWLLEVFFEGSGLGDSVSRIPLTIRLGFPKASLLITNSVGVFQEIALAASSVVAVGTCSIDWELLRIGVWWAWMMIDDLNRLPETPNIEDPGTNCIQGLLNVSDRNQTVWRTLIDILILTRMVSCSDKRDRLFGIRALLAVDDRHLIEPDYSLQTEEVYKATTITHITSCKRLDILNLCVLQNSLSDFKVPSWVPDFSVQD